MRDKGWLSAEVTGYATHPATAAVAAGSESSAGEEQDDDDDAAFIDAHDALYRFTSERPPPPCDPRSAQGADELVVEVVDTSQRSGSGEQRKWPADAVNPVGREVDGNGTAAAAAASLAVAAGPAPSSGPREQLLGQLALPLEVFLGCPAGDR